VLCSRHISSVKEYRTGGYSPCSLGIVSFKVKTAVVMTSEDRTCYFIHIVESTDVEINL
jgi:hypothetical protein